MNTTTLAPAPQFLSLAEFKPALAIVEDDNKMIDLWLHGKSKNTQEAYRRDIEYFQGFIGGKALQLVTLNDLQDYHSQLSDRFSRGTVSRRMAAVKSLLTYGHELGVLAVNAAKPFKVKRCSDRLSERILTENEVHQIIFGFQGKERDRLILKFLYFTGCRVSELCSLTWRNTTTLDDGKAQITIVGKGDKARTVLISSELWSAISDRRGDSRIDDPLFPSRTGRSLTRSQINRIVTRACNQAGIDKGISPHWLRHAHASHSLKRGAALPLVQRSLGHSNLNTTAVYLHVAPEDSSGLYL